MSQCLQLRREAIYHTYSTLVDKKFLFYFIDTKVQMHWEQIFLRISESLIVCHSNQIHVSSDLISYWGNVWRSLEWTWCPWNWMSSHCRQRSTHILKGYCLKNHWNVLWGTQKWFFCRIAQKTPFWNLFRV